MTVLAVGVVALFAAGCGGGESKESAQAPAPEATEFPETEGRTLREIYEEYRPDNDLAVFPAGAVFEKGKKQRFAAAVFTAGGDQINDADLVFYAANGPDAKAKGPYPARVEDLTTKPQFESRTVASDPDSAKAVYVADIDFDGTGEYRLLAMLKDRETGALRTALVSSIQVGADSDVPKPGDKAPLVDTPTVDDVGDVSKIDTRVPHSTMHDVNFADVLGKKPVVLLFATPALCTSRVCGPVVDVAEQLKAEKGDKAAFIHMEVYNDNDPQKGIRPQLEAFGLQSEPWLFVIDEDGRVSTRIEGAYSVNELEQALEKVGV